MFILYSFYGKPQDIYWINLQGVIKGFPQTGKRPRVGFMSLKCRNIDAYHKEEFYLQWRSQEHAWNHKHQGQTLSEKQWLGAKQRRCALLLQSTSISVEYLPPSDRWSRLQYCCTELQSSTALKESYSSGTEKQKSGKETKRWRERPHSDSWSLEARWNSLIYIWQCIKKLYNGSSTAKDSNSHGWLNKHSGHRLMEKNHTFYWMQTVVGQCCYSKGFFCLRQFLVQEMGLSAGTLRARQYIAITLQLSLTAVKETLLEQETFLSLLNPHPRTETPPHHVLPHPYDSLYL